VDHGVGGGLVASKKWKFTGTMEWTFLYPRAFVVKPGEIVEADTNPDPQWFVPADTQATAQKMEK
jgi:hypothetical protein